MPYFAQSVPFARTAPGYPAGQAAAPTITTPIWANGSVALDACMGQYMNFLRQFPEYQTSAFTPTPTWDGVIINGVPETNSALAAFAARFPLCGDWVNQANAQRTDYLTSFCAVPSTMTDPAGWNASHIGCTPVAVPVVPVVPPPPVTPPVITPPPVQPPVVQPPAVLPPSNTTNQPVVPASAEGVTGTQAVIGAAVLAGLVWYFAKSG